MTSVGAYRGDLTLKARAIDDARASMHPGWSVVATGQEREDLAQAYGLTPSFLSLLMAVRGAPVHSEFVAQALELLGIGRDLDALVIDWILGVWQHPTWGVAAKLEGAAVLPAAEAVIETLKSSKVRHVSRQEWRTVRSGVAAARNLMPVQHRYATVVAAMAWDLAATAGLPGDVWIAWDQAFQTEILASAGISEKEFDSTVEAIRAGNRHAWEKFGDPPIDSTAEQAAENASAKAEATEQFISDAGFSGKWKTLNAFFKKVLVPAYSERQPQVLKTVLDICSDAVG